MRKIGVFLNQDINQTTATSIRARGLTENLYEFDIKPIFFGPKKPKFLPLDDFQKVDLPDNIWRYLKLYAFFPEFKRFYKKKIENNIGLIMEMRRKLEQLPLIIHHGNPFLGFFLKEEYDIPYSFDVHGIARLQKEELLSMKSPKKIISFLLRVFKWEKRLFKRADFVHAVSAEMSEYLHKHLSVKKQNILVVPDGLLQKDFKASLSLKDLRKTDLGLTSQNRVIFFAGTFKKIGGVHMLTAAFTKLAQKYTNLILLLIGNGNMERRVYHLISDNQLDNRFIHIRKVPHVFLFRFQNLADVIVCPEIDNTYNRMTPHIKLFDSLVSGKPVIQTRFKVLEKMFVEDKEIYFCEPSNIKSLAIKMEKVLFSKAINSFNAQSLRKKVFEEHSYKCSCARMIKYYRKNGVI